MLSYVRTIFYSSLFFFLSSLVSGVAKHIGTQNVAKKSAKATLKYANAIKTTITSTYVDIFIAEKTAFTEREEDDDEHIGEWR